MTPREQFPETGTFEDFLADLKGLVLPPPKLSLSEWAEEHFRLSAESSAQSGAWRCFPYQREILDCLTDPKVTFVSLMKSARIGYTQCVTAAIGYHIAQEPCPILLVQPTIEDAKGFSKETISPMLRDVPVLAAIRVEDEVDTVKSKVRETILAKSFPGGVLTMIGANSGSGFRRISRRLVIFDECDAYPPSAGDDGDPIKLGTKRADFYWNRKIVAGSTPLVAGTSRIETLFLAGDQRRFYVPCPTCGHMDYLVFTPREDGRGHRMVFDTKAPEETAHFVCSANGCRIDHESKRDMVAKGEWRAHAPFKDHASFHVWAAYSFSPNATWGQIAREFVEANKEGRDKLRVFVNTVLGETWKEAGDVPDWEKLLARREHWDHGTVPEPVKFLTCGVDVQRDRWVFEVVGWGADRQSWTVDAGVLPGRPSNEADWAVVDELLNRTYESVSGPMAIKVMAVDSADQTQDVYGWCHKHPRNRVMATRGVATARVLVSSPHPVDLKTNGKKVSHGYVFWPVGVSMAKDELYGWLKLPRPEAGQPHPMGWCHFPDWLGEDYFKELTGEQLVTRSGRGGLPIHEWQIIPGRQNHYLDCRNYARAAAYVLGLDRMRSAPAAKPTMTPEAQQVVKAAAFEKLKAETPAPQAPAPPPQPRPPASPRKSNWITGDRGSSWLRR